LIELTAYERPRRLDASTDVSRDRRECGVEDDGRRRKES
jgi:hypothetical protein